MIDVSGRKLRFGVAAVAAALLVSGLAAPPVASAQRGPADAAGLAPAQRSRVSLQQAITIATRRIKGRVVRADTIMLNGRPVHEILIIRDDGLVRTIRVDAETGAVL